MRGATHWPSLAMVETIAANCSGEMPISWPIEIAPIETLDKRFTGLASPRVSPGSSMPVCWPNPKARMYL